MRPTSNKLVTLKTLFGSITLCALLFLSSCNSAPGDACDLVICENGGTCIDGTCNCAPGFSGESCQDAIRSQIIGEYDISFYWENENISIEDVVTISESGFSNKDMSMARLPIRTTAGDRNFPIDLNLLIERNKKLRIPFSGVAGEYMVSGDGSLLEDQSIKLSYTVSDQQSGHIFQCHLVAERKQ